MSADQSSIAISWTTPLSDGSSAITGYNIYWDNASGSIINSKIGSTSWQTQSFS